MVQGHSTDKTFSGAILDGLVKSRGNDFLQQYLDIARV